jgi:hypothetical protein
MNHLSHIRRNLATSYTVWVIAVIAIWTNPLQAESFPWWYHAILARHMPHWLIHLLERPWIIAGGAMAYFLIKTIAMATLTIKLIRTMRALKKTQGEHNNLKIKYNLLQEQYIALMRRRHIPPVAHDHQSLSTQPYHATKNQDQ